MKKTGMDGQNLMLLLLVGTILQLLALLQQHKGIVGGQQLPKAESGGPLAAAAVSMASISSSGSSNNMSEMEACLDAMISFLGCIIDQKPAAEEEEDRAPRGEGHSSTNASSGSDPAPSDAMGQKSSRTSHRNRRGTSRRNHRGTSRRNHRGTSRRNRRGTSRRNRRGTSRRYRRGRHRNIGGIDDERRRQEMRLCSWIVEENDDDKKKKKAADACCDAVAAMRPSCFIPAMAVLRRRSPPAVFQAALDVPAHCSLTNTSSSTPPPPFPPPPFPPPPPP
jgi:hypothetical protein